MVLGYRSLRLATVGFQVWWRLGLGNPKRSVGKHVRLPVVHEHVYGEPRDANVGVETLRFLVV